MMHESGTGGAPKYGIIPQMPLTSIDAPVNVLDNQTYSQPRVCNGPNTNFRLQIALTEKSTDWQRHGYRRLLQDNFAEWRRCGAVGVSTCGNRTVLVPPGSETCLGRCFACE
jgi:hypothetical protein